MKQYQIKPESIVEALGDNIQSLSRDIFSRSEHVIFDISNPMRTYYTNENIVEIVKQFFGFNTAIVVGDNDPSNVSNFFISNKYPEYVRFSESTIITGALVGFHKDLLDLIAYELRKPVSLHTDTCFHPRKYRNTLSANLSFVVCPDCKKELHE